MAKTELRCIVSETFDRRLQRFLLELAEKREVRKVSKAQAILEGLNLLMASTIAHELPRGEDQA